MANTKTSRAKEMTMLTPTQYGASQLPPVSKQAVLYRIKHDVPLPGVMKITRVGTRWVLEVCANCPSEETEHGWRARPEPLNDHTPISPPPVYDAPPSSDPVPDEYLSSQTAKGGLTKQQLEIRKKRLGY